MITQLQSGGLDASYIGPSPAITTYASDPSVSIISGATSGGASLMVRDDISSPEAFKGMTLATPGPANTQDVALKYWLGQQGYNAWSTRSPCGPVGSSSPRTCLCATTS